MPGSIDDSCKLRSADVVCVCMMSSCVVVEHDGCLFASSRALVARFVVCRGLRVARAFSMAQKLKLMDCHRLIYKVDLRLGAAVISLPGLSTKGTTSKRHS